MNWKAIAVGMMVMGAGARCAAGAALDQEVSVCVIGLPEYAPALAYAEVVAGKIYANIGVRIDWRQEKNCPAGAIRIRWDSETDVTKHPGALAYARVYQGTEIVILTQRVKDCAQPGSLRQVLGHVLAHEIGHILQGINRHSETGVLKAHWTRTDLAEIAFAPLSFTEADAELIHRGLDFRANRLIADMRTTAGR